LATPHEIDQWLHEGISAAKAGQVEQARFRLLDVVEQQQTNEAAWYWLYQVFDTVEDKRICLENLVLINPHNRWAKQELLNYLAGPSASGITVPPTTSPAPGKKGQKKSRPVPKRPVTLYLVSAFWFGISIIFLGSGIITAGEWLVTNLNGQGIVSIFRFVNPLIAALFMSVGLFGFFVAIALLLRTMFGFYGSLILGLGLLLVGPTLSLVANPPNYLALICTGGISGMIVLLTLASQSAFENLPHHDTAAS
jgi:hypothetical protein